MTLPALPEFSPVAAVLLALLAFGTLGYFRGWIRELAALGGVLFVWLVVVAFGLTLVGWANKVALIVTFSWQGGFESTDPLTMIRELRTNPLLDPWQPEWFYVVVFLIGVVATYLASGRMVSRIRGVNDSLLGALAGALNGYVISYVLLGYIQATAGLYGSAAGPTREAFGFLGGYLTTLAVAVVVGVVAIALLGSSRGNLKSKRAGRSGG